MAAGDVEVNLTNPKARRCAFFDGVDDYVVLGSKSLPEISLTKQYSISLWVYAEKAADGMIFSSVGGSADRCVIFYDGDEDGLEIGHWDGSSYNGKKAVLNLNQWYNIVMTHTNGTNKLYINGIENTGVGSPASSSSIGTYLGICTDASTNAFNGFISDVQIFNRIISQAEAVRIYQGFKVTNGLKRQWKLDFNYKNILNDVTPTVVGSVLTAIDDQVGVAIKADRTTANDKYQIVEMNGKILSVIVEESA
jgi:hypothetical protein